MIGRMAGNRMPTQKDWLKDLNTKSAGTKNNSWSTGKAADSGYTTVRSASPTLRVQVPTTQSTTKNAFQSGTFGTSRRVTGRAADSGITRDLRRMQQQANRQTVSNLFQGTKNTNKLSDYSLAKGADELWRLERIWGQYDWANEHTGRNPQAKDNMPAIANFADDNYNESTQNLFRRYTSSIDSGKLSPLADFALHQQVNDEMDRLFNSVVTSNGIAITGKSFHSVARVIGSVEQRRNGVSVADVLHALTDEDSEVLPIKVCENGRSQKFRSDKVEVSVNPDTGIIIQVNPVHSKREVKQ